MVRWTACLTVGAWFLGMTTVSVEGQTTPPAQTAQNPPAAADSKTYTLSTKLEKGQTYRFQTQQSLTMKFKVDKTSYGFNSGMDATLRYKVQEVKSDGNATLTVLFDGGKLISVDNQVKMQEKERDDYPRTAMIDRSNRVLSVLDKGRANRKEGQLEFFSDVNLMVPLHFLPMPGHALKVGDTWKTSDPLPNAKKEKRETDKPEVGNADDKNLIRSELTFLGTDKIGNRETLKVKHIVTIPIEAFTDKEGKAVPDSKRAEGRLVGQLAYGQFVQLDPLTGQILRTEGQIQGEIKFEGVLAKLMPSDTMTIEGEFLTLRLEEGAKDAPANK